MDGDGTITIDELKHAMQKLLGETTNRKEIEAVVREADNNGDGTVDFEGDSFFFLMQNERLFCSQLLPGFVWTVFNMGENV